MKTQITGHDLIALGFRQGKWMKDAITHINENELEGEALENYLEQFKSPDPIALHDAPIAFSINIKAEDELEEDNVF